MLSIVGTVGVPACYGGFETLVENLLDENVNDSNITIYCSSFSYDEKTSFYKNARLVYVPLRANGAQSILYDIVSIFHAAFSKSDYILILGVSGAICLPLVRLFSKAKLITNIDGLEWQRDKWHPLVKLFLKFSEKIAVKFSDVVVADNQAIADHVLTAYGVNANIIAYGGDHALVESFKSEDYGYALALCRIEPENNVEMILEAFSRTSKNLKFIGNWERSEFGKNMAAKYGVFSNICLINPIYDLKKLFDFRQSCSFYVHGHSAGGTNPSLVEMMHFGKNVLAFDCNYNRFTTEGDASYFKSIEGLVSLIEKPDSSNDNFSMLEIAERRYTWSVVRKQYFDLF